MSFNINGLFSADIHKGEIEREKEREKERERERQRQNTLLHSWEIITLHSPCIKDSFEVRLVARYASSNQLIFVKALILRRLTTLAEKKRKRRL
jgi:hypothetical protein